MKILNARQMREIDRLTVERCGIPWSILMETAGSRVVEAIVERIGPVAGRYIAVLCGKGNNGGDGAVIARQLWMRGASVDAFLFGRIDETKGEARVNFEILHRISEGKGGNEHPSSDLFFYEDASVEQVDMGYDVVVDAIFGAGLSRPAEGIHAEAIETIRMIRGHETSLIVSVDIPSGLSSDQGAPIGIHVDADLTVSFTAPKPGNVLSPACRSNGDLIIASIGTPDWLIDRESGSSLNLVEEGMVSSWLRDTVRPVDAHKGAVGDVLLVAGSRGKTGAAALASAATLRAGAGLVTVATAMSAQTLLVGQVLPEVMTEPLEETREGSISHSALDRALELTQPRTVLAIGPGLSSADPETREFVRQLLTQRRLPVILDADGLNAVAPWPADLRASDDLPIIVTPHPGEMARLTGLSNSEVTSDRLAVARDFARRSGAVTVLKGSRTIIASPDGDLFVNATGNPGMATAGSGDVLTGLLAGLLAQRPGDPLGAAIAAVYLHGLAGDLAARQSGIRSLIASDITGHLSEAFLLTGGTPEHGDLNFIKRII
ncbi:MAG: NAD(P)H-hydrate dehydratase [Acidobacteriota bacterium]|nr:MAG: NAD(P)H-hydrate dehydratase [Acidobacteriota bacterium]